MSAKVSTFSRGIKSGGVTVENEPIIKSDGASSDVMEWQASTGTSTVKVREDASNNMDLLVNGVPVTGGASGSTNDGQGLHFDGAAGNIDIASPPDLGTKFSMEFVIQADEWGSATYHVLDFGSSGRMLLYTAASIGYNLGLYDTGEHSFGVKVLDDLKVHHIVITVDGTSAILYDNGNQVGVATIATPTLDLAADLVIGAKYDGLTGWFNGTIYRARFWNKTLSQAEITSVYESASLDYADQWGSQTSKILNGTAWTGATGATVPTSWTAGTAGTYTIDSAAGSGAEPALRINRDGTNTNPYTYQTFTAIIGNKYRVSYKAKNGTATSARVGIGSAVAGIDYDYTDYTTTSWVEFDETFTATSTVFSVYASAITSTGTEYAYVDSVSVVQIGCVSDYDLAYANPTQSNIVRNRSDAGDGTAAGGVVQITKIEAVNTNKLSVGGTTPLVGIGLAAGVTPGNILHVADGAPRIRLEDTSAPSNFSIIGADNGQLVLSADEGEGQASSAVIFKVDDSEKMRIDSAGAVKVQGGTGDGDSYNAELAFQRTSSTGNVLETQLIFDDADTNFGDLVVKTKTGASSGAGTFTEAMRIAGSTGLATFSAGIAFESSTSGTGSSASSYTLDHYEEGTWTPALSAPSSGTLTYTSTGLYTRIGDLVHIAVTIDVTVVTSLPAESFRITNVPFNSKEVMAGKYYLNNFGISQATCVKTAERTEDMHIGSYAASDDNYIYINQHGSLINLDDLQVGFLQYSGTFKTSDA